MHRNVPKNIADSYQLLLLSMACKDYQKITNILSTCKDDLFLTQDLNGQTILHHALKSDDEEIINIVLTGYGKLKSQLKRVITTPDRNGWTALHFAAQFCNEKSFTDFENVFGEDLLMVASKLINSELKFPLQLVHHNMNYSSLHDKLLKITLAEEELNGPINLDVDPIVSCEDEYLSFEENELLRKRLELGAQLALQIRRLIHWSITHKECNNYEKVFREFITELQNQVRDICDREEENISNEKENYKDSDSYNLKLLECIVQNAFKYAVGNCHEYAHAVFYALTKLKVDAPAEIYHFENGDHVFVVLGRDPLSNPKDYRTWGKTAVVIDAWSGQVYPARQIPQKLRDHFEYPHGEERYNITIPYNLNYHSLAPDDYLTFSEKVFVQEEQKPNTNYINLNIDTLNLTSSATPSNMGIFKRKMVSEEESKPQQQSKQPRSLNTE